MYNEIFADINFNLILRKTSQRLVSICKNLCAVICFLILLGKLCHSITFKLNLIVGMC